MRKTGGGVERRRTVVLGWLALLSGNSQETRDSPFLGADHC